MYCHMSAAPKILVVEDDLFLRDIYHQALVEGGFDVTTAIDGEEGLNKITQGGWDLVLLDYMMPKKNGIEVMHELKAMLPKVFAKRVIFLTNIDDTNDINEINRVSDGYLLKTQMTPKILITNIKNYLSQASQAAA